MYSILIVDDEPWTLLGIRDSFDWEGMGFNVIGWTTDPKEAFDIILKSKPDVVVTDIKMPGISGIELIGMARENGIESEFVIISGFADFNFAKEAMKYNVQHYLLKPIDIIEGMYVFNKISEMLDKRHVEVKTSYGVNTKIFNDNFKELLDYVNNNFKGVLYLNDLSVKFHLNKTYICDLFKKTTGKTFSKYLIELKLAEACRLLRKTDMLIQEIAESIGYDSVYFDTIFKKQYGLTPSQYRNGDN